ncbi:MAG: EscU/YscU/HrcU family type III secretion system export apparatus switch protein [Lentisphaeraceae bacterium]|nr:EscU/YscU/HrcU family type III secretion system export apparatus switch protein [Lentisphaeraceae bacterium]
MANSDPSKTEQATAKRKSEERNKGNIPISQDVTSVIAILTVTLLLALLLPQFHKSFTTVFKACFELDVTEEWTSHFMKETLHEGFKLFAPSLFFLITIIFVVTVIAIRAQTGSFFKTRPLHWKFDFINLGNGLKNLIPNKKKIVNFFLTMAKVSLIGMICYFIIKGEIETLAGLITLPVEIASEIMLKIAFKVVLITVSLFIIIAIIDIIYKRKHHADDLMMSKDEVKDEKKNAEGDPKIKMKIRNKMRSMHFANMQSNVRIASVVITNPTHVAVALEYVPGQSAPKVVAKGLRKKALRIKQIAKDAGIPTIEAPPLARSLYRTTEVGQTIDQQFYSAVAIILAKIFKKKKVLV